MTRPDLQVDVLGGLLRMVAHDLRNPLAVIISNGTYLRDVLTGSSSDVADTISDTLTSCEELRHIIENLDLVGQRLSDASVPATSGFYVSAAVEQAARRCASFALGHEVELECDLSGGESLLCQGAMSLFERAVSNLVRNAIEHSPSGSRVAVRVTADGNRGNVTVLDRGVSLSPYTWSSEFTPQGQAASKRDPSGRYGRGLGLLCAKLAAEAIGAELSVCEPSAGYSCAMRLSAPLRPSE